MVDKKVTSMSEEEKRSECSRLLSEVRNAAVEGWGAGMVERKVTSMSMSEEEIRREYSRLRSDLLNASLEAHYLWYEERYRDTSNPLFVWKIIKACGETDSPYPAWVKEYLSEAAKDILNLQKNRSKNDGSTIGDLAAESLGLKKGVGKDFYKDLEKEQRSLVSFIFAKEMKKQGITKEEAFSALGKFYKTRGEPSSVCTLKRAERACKEKEGYGMPLAVVFFLLQFLQEAESMSSEEFEELVERVS